MNETDSDIEFDTFQPFPKLHRLHRDIVITEKIDGTNAQIIISNDGKQIRAASRKRFITPEDDNYGFARWVEENRDDLLKLGPGRHFGEWWGQGIQRKYGLANKRFSLFNTHRWGEWRPLSCHVVPTLYVGEFSEEAIGTAMLSLDIYGSRAVPHWMKPEGIVIFHTQSRRSWKYTLDGDGHKGAR